MIVATFALILDGFPLAWIVAAAGFGIGIKPTYAFALPGFALLWIWRFRSSPPAPDAHRLDKGLWVIALLGLTIGSVWYVRNAILFGNPVYPAGTDSFDFGDRK